MRVETRAPTLGANASARTLLQVLLEPGVSILWGWLWVLVMIVVASFTVRSRAPEVPGLLPLALLAFGCSLTFDTG